ncbi:hypothetical protein J437_LFUL001310 [Ladona fulva]|uniref:Single-pass membrane and coiled-coil domain-containing protein 4 homolog n=1 Tax=Ladona fulva TaxID=123851 RepID=A0A8K0NXG1_LADFU|nr:hypothetical protein J437_LFUL001310 [Ladona fulva]
MRQLKGKVKETNKQKKERKKDFLDNKKRVFTVAIPAIVAVFLLIVASRRLNSVHFAFYAFLHKRNQYDHNEMRHIPEEPISELSVLESEMEILGREYCTFQLPVSYDILFSPLMTEESTGGRKLGVGEFVFVTAAGSPSLSEETDMDADEEEEETTPPNSSGVIERSLTLPAITTSVPAKSFFCCSFEGAYTIRALVGDGLETTTSPSSDKKGKPTSMKELNFNTCCKNTPIHNSH